MKYRAITSENFYFIEMKKACKFLLKNKDIENIREEFWERDILDVTSPSNFQKKYSTISRRLKTLSENLRGQLIENDSQTGKVINLYSILCSERIVLEFMDEVIKEKYETFEYYIYQKDFNIFMNSKVEQSDIIANWTEITRKKIIVKLKNFLLESGYLVKIEENQYKISRPIILPEIIEEMKKGENKQLVKAMLY